jgi:hypothetical protein
MRLGRIWVSGLSRRYSVLADQILGGSDSSRRVNGRKELAHWFDEHNEALAGRWLNLPCFDGLERSGSRVGYHL